MEPHNSDKSFVQCLWDIPAAFVLLTRLPVPPLPDRAFAHSARAVWAYPVVGLVLGVMVAAIGWLSGALGLPPMVSAGLMLAGVLLLTGAMHEDGLADSADGLWGGHDPSRRLEIMKDSRIGAYGVLALLVVMGLRWQGFGAVAASGVIVALVVSRAMMPLLMCALPHARSDGLSQSVGDPPLSAVLVGLGFGFLVALVLAKGAGVMAMVVAILVTLLVAAIARRKINGQTGDILGATQVLSEVAILLTMLACAQ